MAQETIPIPTSTSQPTRDTPHTPYHGESDIMLHFPMGEHALGAKMAVAEQMVVVADFFGGVGLDAGYVGPAGGAEGRERCVDALGVFVQEDWGGEEGAGGGAGGV